MADDRSTPDASTGDPEGVAGRRLAGAALVAVAMGVMNVASYAYQMVAARLLGPQDYGAFAALMNLVLVVNVLALALQANAARRIAAEPGEVHTVERAIRHVGRQGALALAAVTLAAAPLINWLLRLDSLATSVMVGLSAVPLTLMGYQAGVLQGERRWHALGLVYASAGVVRLFVGTALLLMDPTPFWAITGVVIGAWAPVVVGAVALRQPRGTVVESDASHTARDLWSETMRNSHALLAYFALCNADIVIARSMMDAHQAGLYAAGLIMTKIVLFLPQFVVVLAYPSMGVEASRRRTLLQSLAAVGLLSALVSALTSVLSGLAMVFVGGAQYSAIEESLWAFALLGGLLAMLQIVVYGVLARQARRSVYLLWVGLAAVAVLGSVAETFDDLLVIVISVDAGLLVVLVLTSLLAMRHVTGSATGLPAELLGSVSGSVPAAPGADGDVERNGQGRG